MHVCSTVSFCVAPLRLLGLAGELFARAKWYRNLYHEAGNKTLVETRNVGIVADSLPMLVWQTLPHAPPSFSRLAA